MSRKDTGPPPTEPAYVGRRPAILPTFARRHLLAAVLVSTLVITLLPRLPDVLGVHWPGPSSWLEPFHLDNDGSFANAYSVVLWTIAAVLAALKAWSHRSWNQRVGWASFASLSAAIAVADNLDLKKPLFDGASSAAVDPSGGRLLVTVLIVLSLTFMAGAALWQASRHDPILRLLALSAAVLGCSALAHDAITEYPRAFEGWRLWLEEGSEYVTAVLLIAILANSRGSRGHSSPGAARIAGVVLLGVTMVSLVPLGIEHHIRDSGWQRSRLHSYAGPVSLVEQTIRIDHAWLTRIDVWAAVDGGDQVDMFMRLMPVGSDRPIRESHAIVRHRKWSDATVSFIFQPIPNSQHQDYDLAIGSLSGPSPYLFLGFSGNDPNPTSGPKINGVSTRYANDLAMNAYWQGRGLRALIVAIASDMRIIVVFVDIWLTVSLWIFSVAIAWKITRQNA